MLLVDEIDRSDEEFEAYLLELLSDYQITIPEIGTIKAAHPPVVIITSNRTREIHDGLKRRCLYYWIDYPSFEKELEIVRTKLPLAPAELSQQVTAFVQELRRADLYKLPGVAETLDWAAALMALDQQALSKSGGRGYAGGAAEIPGRRRKSDGQDGGRHPGADRPGSVTRWTDPAARCFTTWCCSNACCAGWGWR